MSDALTTVQNVYEAFGRGDLPALLGFERTQALPGGGVFETEWVHVWQLREGRVARFFGMIDTEASARARP